MICPKCNTENPEGYRFCFNCGASLTDNPTANAQATMNNSAGPSVSAPQETVRSETATPLQNFPQNKGFKVSAALVGLAVLFLLTRVSGIYNSLTAHNTPDNSVEREETQNKHETVTQPSSSPSPTTSLVAEPSPTPEQQTTGREFNTMEEALTFALTDSGMEYAETARIENIKLVYTPTYKQWTFEFTSKINPHKKDRYSETLYDFPTTTVKIKNTGEFKVHSFLLFKDSKGHSYSQYPKPSEVALSSFLDLAKQKVVAAGAMPGGIITAEYHGYTGDWEVNVVLKGEEEKDEKAAKKVTFRDGVLKGIEDVSVTLNVDQEF